MRLMNWNIEWMNNWFVGGNQVAWRNDHSSGITDMQALAGRVANVIKAVGPDVLAIQEGPSDPQEMKLFVTDHLGDSYDILGGFDGAAQKVYALVKKGGNFGNAALAEDDLTKGLVDTWEVDTDGDLMIENYDFTRNPLVVDGDVGTTGKRMRLVALHTKSKYVHNGETMWNDPARRLEFISLALKARRRISAEAYRTRKYIDDLLKEDATAWITVCGDFNDGPGHDFFEQRYLTHNITDIILGSTFRPEGLFAHAFLGRVTPAHRFTVVFDDFVDEIDDRRILLDHIVVSPDMAGSIADGGISHNEFEAEIDNTAGGRQKLPSDHRPTFMDL